jgi:aminoglycoside 6'-N-acetyltransferase I
MITIRMLGPGDAAALDHVAADVFDNDVDPAITAEFMADPRHHLAVAIDAGTVVGMASAVHYVHPDKPTELWINEVGVAPTHHRRGIGRQLVAELLKRGQELGCAQAWVLTDVENAAARGLYAAAGGAETTGVVMVEFDLKATT